MNNPNQETPVSVFRTDQGSVYFVHHDGTTTRVKAKRPQHKDFGRKVQSVKTVYLTKENAARLALPQATWRMIDNYDGTLTLTILRDNRQWRPAPSATAVPYENVPQPGLLPLELWQPETYRQLHFGNPIAEVM